MEEHDNDSLSKRVSHEGGQKWQDFREGTQKQAARARHRLKAQTKRDIRVKDNVHGSEWCAGS